MKKVKRKQIDFGGTSRQLVRGDGELDFYDNKFVVEISLDNATVSTATSENLVYNTTVDEIVKAINDNRIIDWFFVYSKPSNNNVGRVVKLNIDSVYSSGKNKRLYYRTWLSNIDYNNRKLISIHVSLRYDGLTKAYKILSEYKYTDIRTIGGESLIQNAIFNVYGDSNLFDGTYYPNAVQDNDGNWYNAVILGNQVWLAENLRTKTFSDGTPIEEGDSLSNTPAYQDKISSNISFKNRGLFYNHYAVLNGSNTTNNNPSGIQGVAPIGFHIPSFAEFEELYNYLSRQYRYRTVNFGFDNLKCIASVDNWTQWTPRNYCIAPGHKSYLNNETGFNAYPTGLLTGVDGSSIYFWTVTNSEEEEDKAIYVYGVDDRRDQSIAKFIVSEDNYETFNTFLPVRCISDLNPIQFRNWYIQQYGSLQHHLPENSVVYCSCKDDTENISNTEGETNGILSITAEEVYNLHKERKAIICRYKGINYRLQRVARANPGPNEYYTANFIGESDYEGYTHKVIDSTYVPSTTLQSTIIREFNIPTPDSVYASIYENITYSALKELIDNNELIKGKKYRITDYVTTTTQTDTQSAGHQFDIVVTAKSNSALYPEASALLHSGDTYFSSNNVAINKWQIWYDINNDTTKYEWADDTNGKGVIYRMIDEWGNDCPYDFKNILFTRKLTDDSYDPTNGTDTLVYTFGGTTDASITDVHCYNNILKERKKPKNSSKRVLLDTVFLGTKCHNNTFGNNCYGNTFGSRCHSNTFKNDCRNNTFKDDCSSNTFGNNCCNNNFDSLCAANTFEDNCFSNILGLYCIYNTFREDCLNITFGDSNNQNGDYIKYVIIENGNKCIRLYNSSSASTSNRLQNIYIAQGVNNSDTYLDISTIERNLNYRTTVGRDSQGNIRIYNEDDPIDASQVSGLPRPVFYGYTSTAESTATKVVTLGEPTTGFANGSYLVLYFTSGGVPAGNDNAISVGGTTYALAYKGQGLTQANVIKTGDKVLLWCHNGYAHVIAIDRWGSDIAACMPADTKYGADVDADFDDNYTEITDTTGKNPAQEGWFVRTGTAPDYIYTLTEDTTPVAGTTYYSGGTYIITVGLKDQDGNRLGTAKTIDLPLESVVVDGSFNNTTKKLSLTLKNGRTIEVDLGDIINGLQTTLVSGTNIKTINNESILGSGNLSVHDVVWCTYTETDSTNHTGTMSMSIAELQAAISNGVLVCVEYANNIYVISNDGNITIQFNCVQSNSVRVLTYFNSDQLWHYYYFVLQQELESGTNIKTINNTSILGRGNIDLSGYALKSEMSITDGTDTNADKTTIQLKSGLSRQVLIQHQDISGKADKSEMSVTDGTGNDADKVTIQLKSGTSATVLKEHQSLDIVNNNINRLYDVVSDLSDKLEVELLPTGYVIDQRGTITDPDTMVSANYYISKENLDKAFAGTLTYGDVVNSINFISDNANVGLSNKNSISWIRKHAHLYVGKWDGTNMKLKQLSDTDKTKFVDGTDATTYITNAASDSTYSYDVWLKFENDVYYRGFPLIPTGETIPNNDIQLIVFCKDKPSNPEQWEKFDKNKLIAVYKGYVVDNKAFSISGVQATNNITQTNAKAYAINRGTGFKLIDFQAQSIEALMFYGLYSNLNSQGCCGMGTTNVVNSVYYPKKTGLCNNLGMTDTDTVNGNGASSPAASDIQAGYGTGIKSVNFMGIENWWGDIYEWMDDLQVMQARRPSSVATANPSLYVDDYINDYITNHSGATGAIICIDGVDTLVTPADIANTSTYAEDDRFVSIRDISGNIVRVINSRLKAQEGNIAKVSLGDHGYIFPKALGGSYNVNSYCDYGCVGSVGAVALRSYRSAYSHGGVAFLSLYYGAGSSYSAVGFRLLFEGTLDNTTIVENGDVW